MAHFVFEVPTVRISPLVGLRQGDKRRGDKVWSAFDLVPLTDDRTRIQSPNLLCCDLRTYG